MRRFRSKTFKTSQKQAAQRAHNLSLAQAAFGFRGIGRSNNARIFPVTAAVLSGLLAP